MGNLHLVNLAVRQGPCASFHPHIPLLIIASIVAFQKAKVKDALAKHWNFHKSLSLRCSVPELASSRENNGDLCGRQQRKQQEQSSEPASLRVS
jgi:hypothetical protein